MPIQQQNALMKLLRSMQTAAKKVPASQISKPIGPGGPGVRPSQDGMQLRQLQKQLAGQGVQRLQQFPQQTQPLGSAGGFGGMGSAPMGMSGRESTQMSPEALKYLQGMQPGEIGPYNTTTQQNIMGGMGGGMGVQMQGMGSEPMGMGGQGPYSPGMQVPLNPYNTTTLNDILGQGNQPVPGMFSGQPLGSAGGFGGMGGQGPYSPGMQVPLNPYNTTTQQNIMGQTTPQAPNQLSSTGRPFYSGIASLFGSKK